LLTFFFETGHQFWFYLLTQKFLRRFVGAGLCKVHLCLRVQFLLKTDSGYPKDTEVTLFTLATLGIPFAITPFGQLHQSPPSPIPGHQARGKRRGFSPGAAHISLTPAPTDLQSTFSLCFLILSEIGRLPRIFLAKSEIGHIVVRFQKN